jgi:pimeloyl-ACP methyl ester carboxylesterase
MLCDERLFAPQLAAFGESHRVIVGELTGRQTIKELAEDLLAQIPEGTFNLAGLSMGGIVAMEMAGIAPARILRLALLDTNHLSENAEKRKIRDRQIAQVRAGNLQQVIIEEMKPNYLAIANRQNRQLLDLLIDMALGLGEDVFVSQSLALRNRNDQSEHLSAYQGSVLALCGDEDRLCPPERHRQICALSPHSELVVVPAAGHITTLENPTSVNAALADWLTNPAPHQNDRKQS